MECVTGNNSGEVHGQTGGSSSNFATSTRAHARGSNEPTTMSERQACNARLRQWRQAQSAQGCARLEVTIGKGLIEQARAYAASKGLKLWEVVEEALEQLVTGNDKR